jgi:ABC-type dipeptide/oligopeptide/nickel transport system permease component
VVFIGIMGIISRIGEVGLGCAGMLFALIGVSMPVFWLGQLLLYFLWFKLGSRRPPDWGRLEHLAIHRAGQVHPAWIACRDVRRVLRADGPRQPDRDDE